MKLSPQLRMALLALDALALVGVIGFSVAAAVEQDHDLYVIGQIVCVAVVLGTALLLRRAEIDES